VKTTYSDGSTERWFYGTGADANGRDPKLCQQFARLSTKKLV